MVSPNFLNKEELDDLLANVGRLDYEFDYGGRTFRGYLKSVDVYIRDQEFYEVYVTIDPYPIPGPSYQFVFKYWT
jgi:hypothetical protein